MSRWMCCFCGQTIKGHHADPVLLEIPLTPEGTQALYAHLTCLRRALHPSVPLGVFDDQGEVDGSDGVVQSE
jgi:hypothetical protein